MTEPHEGSRLRSPAILAIAAVLLAAAAGWVALGSPLFEVERITVRGARHLDPDRVRSLARVPADANLLSLSLDRVAARVERDPWVADAAATRDLPSTVVLTIRERTARGWVEAEDGVVVLAGDGTVLRRRTAPPDALPELDGAAPPPPGAERIETIPPALRVTASMPRDLLTRARSARDGGEGIMVRLRGGGEVDYGPLTQLAQKHRAAVSVLGWAEEHGVEVELIDVRVPSAPTLRAPGGAVEVPAPLAPSPTPVD